MRICMGRLRGGFIFGLLRSLSQGQSVNRNLKKQGYVGWIKRSGSTIVVKIGGTALLVPSYKKILSSSFLRRQESGDLELRKVTRSLIKAFRDENAFIRRNRSHGLRF